MKGVTESIVEQEYRRPDGSIAGAPARVLDFDDPDNNDWLAAGSWPFLATAQLRTLTILSKITQHGE